MNQGRIQMSDFISKLQEIDYEKKLDYKIINDVANRFAVPNGMN